MVIETNMGKITVELDPERTPITVENFLEYVETGFYDSTLFHQVMEGYAILGGSYSVEWREKPTRVPIRNEADRAPDNSRGTIAMARLPETIDSATSQFFINVADNPALDYKGGTAEEYGYCVFGKVVEGMEVVDRIAAVPVEDTEEFQRKPIENVVIERTRRIK